MLIAEDLRAVEAVWIGDQDPLALVQDRVVRGVPRDPQALADPSDGQTVPEQGLWGRAQVILQVQDQALRPVGVAGWGRAEAAGVDAVLDDPRPGWRSGPPDRPAGRAGR